MKDNELSKLKESIASLQKSIGAGISAMPDSNPQKDTMDKMHQMCSNMYDYMDSIASRLNKHNDPSSHIPPIQGPGQMKKVIKALGMDDSYEVKPRVIYANKNDIIIEASYIKPNA